MAAVTHMNSEATCCNEFFADVQQRPVKSGSNLWCARVIAALLCLSDATKRRCASSRKCVLGLPSVITQQNPLIRSEVEFQHLSTTSRAVFLEAAPFLMLHSSYAEEIFYD